MPPSHLEYDFAVLGGGSAGYAAARTAASLGLKTTVIDGSPTLGGLCILRGCMPSKTLIESANRFITLRRANEFGLRNDHLQVIPQEIRDRKRRLIGDFADYRQEQLADGPFDLLRGSGKFLDPHSIEVTPLAPDTEPLTIKAKTFLVATGSVIKHLNLPGAKETAYLTSDDVLDNDHIPKSIIVLGGGAIALEMAHYFEGVGAKVTVIQRSPHVLKELDDDVTSAVETALRNRGIELFTDTTLEQITVEDGKKIVHFNHHGKPASTQADEILMALGRSPATASLQLNQAGVDLEGPRILTNDLQATSAEHIFAAGDCCGPHEIVHIAIEQGEIAANNAAIQLGRLDPGLQRTIDYRLKILGIFTEPQVATVGLTEREAAQANLPTLTASYPFNDHGKSIVRGETEGFVKLIAHADTGELIGGAAVGPEAVELIHEIVVAMHFRATASILATIPHYHPTLSEIWTYPAEEISTAVLP
jgi:pyruvate/2-oxoglutarate dehydrogenase complex dihydrolipoamide dehydrogenase (E3) component